MRHSLVVGKAAFRVFTQFNIAVHITQFNCAEAGDHLPHIARKLFRYASGPPKKFGVIDGLNFARFGFRITLCRELDALRIDFATASSIGIAY
jgi:hypothetical protein